MDKLSYFNDLCFLAKQFKVGDVVKFIEPRRLITTPFLGTVTAVLEGIGCIDVQFPTGYVRVQADELLLTTGDGPQYDTGPDTWDRRQALPAKAKVAAAYQNRVLPLLDVAGSMKEAGVEELDTYHLMFKKYAAHFSDSEIRGVVKEAYHTKLAMYWKEKGRKYSPSKVELDSGIFHCPKCDTELSKTVYKKHTKLYACKSCLFLIKPSDILDCAGPDADLEDCLEESDGGLGFNVSDPSKSFNEWL